MKVLIVGGGFVNKGAEAMVKTVQAEIGARIPGASMFVPQETCADDAAARAEGVGVAPNLSKGRKTLRCLALAAAQPPLLGEAIRWRRLKSLESLWGIDAVLDVSGYAYGDGGPRGFEGSSRMCAMAVYAKALGKPYVCMPQAWGPFSDPDIARISREICRKAALVFVRDNESLDALASLFPQGLPPQVRTSPDIAFLFQPADPAWADRRLGEAGLRDEGRPLALLAPNRRVYERTRGTGDGNEYVQDLIEISRRLLATGYAVAFLPHETALPGSDRVDDRGLCAQLEAAVADDSARALLAPMSAGEMKAVIGRMTCVIGSRFHALVAALSQGVPCMALSWSHKYRELLRPFGLEKYAVESADGIGGRTALLLLDEFIESVPALRVGVESVLPDVRRQAAETFDLTAKALQRM